MLFRPVSSSTLRAVGYNELTRSLLVSFHSGEVWQYNQVPYLVYVDLLAASSKKDYLEIEIKPQFAGKRII